MSGIQAYLYRTKANKMWWKGKKKRKMKILHNGWHYQLIMSNDWCWLCQQCYNYKLYATCDNKYILLSHWLLLRFSHCMVSFIYHHYSFANWSPCMKTGGREVVHFLGNPRGRCSASGRMHASVARSGEAPQGQHRRQRVHCYGHHFSSWGKFI